MTIFFKLVITYLITYYIYKFFSKKFKDAPIFKNNKLIKYLNDFRLFIYIAILITFLVVHKFYLQDVPSEILLNYYALFILITFLILFGEIQKQMQDKYKNLFFFLYVFLGFASSQIDNLIAKIEDKQKALIKVPKTLIESIDIKKVMQTKNCTYIKGSYKNQEITICIKKNTNKNDNI